MASMFELPHSAEAEMSLLGCLLRENGLLHGLPHLKADHFHFPVHQRVFEAINDKLGRGETANPVTLRERFQADDALSDLGGAGYLAKLAGASLNVPNVGDYARHVMGLAKRRELMAGCLEAVRMAAEDFEQQPEEIAARVGRISEQVAAEMDAMQTRDCYEVTESIIADMQDRKDPVSTGLSSLDLAMGGGLYPGRSYGFAARKKVGKTILASTISFNLNRAGVRHLFICGEMGPKEIHERCLARALNVFPSDFREEKRKDPRFQQRIRDAAARENRCTIYQNAPGLTFDSLRRYLASAISRRKIEGVILDYWQLVGGKGKGKSTSEHLDEVAQWIADFCRQHGIWSVVMAQINQEGNTRGGEGIRLAFDQVYELIREEESSPQAWLKMLDTRYTRWENVGSPSMPGLMMKEKGPWFDQFRVAG